MSLPEFLEAARPLAHALKNMRLDDAESAKTAIAKIAPVDGPLVNNIRDHALAGLKEGWLLTKEVGGIRFGRAAKDLEGFSVDAVLLSVAGPKHRHPNGEIDLCFTTRGDPRFDGHPQGWVVFAPGSAHVPTVTGGEMLILYFLPGGAFEILDQ